MGKRYEEMTFAELLEQMDRWRDFVLCSAKYDNSITSDNSITYDGAKIYQQLRLFIGNEDENVGKAH